MACFTLTGAQRALLANCIEVGLEGCPSDAGPVDDILENIILSLRSSNNTVEITVMPLERFKSVGEPMEDLNDDHLGAREDDMSEYVGDLEEELGMKE
jgi:hypothetical protein